MIRFRDLKLAGKLSALVLFTTGTALVLLFGAFLALARFETRRSLVNELLSVAEIIGNNSTAALSFGDTRTGRENLEALRADSRILGAAIYTSSGSPFASYNSAAGQNEFRRPMEIPSGAMFEDGSAILVRGISLNGQSLGRIILRADLR